MPKRTFGERLRATREAAELTLEAVGKAVGVSPQAVYRWEHGLAMPSSDRVARLANALQVSPTFLLTGTDAVRESSHTGRGHRIVPVYRAEDVASDKRAEVGQANTHFPCSPNAYAIQLWDNSNAPEYRAGDQVVIDPDMEPEPGDMVLVALGVPPMPVFGKYVTRPHNTERTAVIQHLNADWAEHVLGPQSSVRILGVMSEHARPRRR